MFGARRGLTVVKNGTEATLGIFPTTIFAFGKVLRNASSACVYSALNIPAFVGEFGDVPPLTAKPNTSFAPSQKVTRSGCNAAA